MEFKFETNKQFSTIDYVIFSLVMATCIACLSGPLNKILINYGRQLNTIACHSFLNFKNENIQKLFYQICISTKDNKLTNEEIYSLIDFVQNSFNYPYKKLFYSDKRVRDMRIEYSTGYEINSYINKIKQNRLIDYNKPKGYFENVYTPNIYNKEQIVLLEQAKYTEYELDGSYAQQVLGPKRELSYVGLKFPYGSTLEVDK